MQNLENGLRLSEGKESRIEKALGWKIGSLDRIRDGGEPVLVDDERDEFTPRDDFERKVWASKASRRDKLHYIRRHRAALEEEARVLHELDSSHPGIATESNDIDTRA